MLGCKSKILIGSKFNFNVSVNYVKKVLRLDPIVNFIYTISSRVCPGRGSLQEWVTLQGYTSQGRPILYGKHEYP
jgi:hypothetical protein